MRPGRGTAVRVIPELMDMHASLGVGVVARDVVHDLGRARLGLLLERHGALDFGVSAQDGDYDIGRP